MTPLALTVALLALLVAGAKVGPRVLGGPTPTFSARPRLGLATWTASAAVWTLAFLALGPLLTWVFTGPGLPGRVGAVCQRCLTAANPFSARAPLWTTGVPVYTMLLVPLALTVWLITSATLRHLRSREQLRTHLRGLTAVAHQRRLLGSQVWVVPTPDRAVYSLPARRARIVISQGALDALSGDQLTAVLAHERAHIEQRHHALLWALHSLRGVLGWVPLIAAAAPAVATYAEMAADDNARRASSTRALAGALLALHGPGPSPVLNEMTCRLVPRRQVVRLAGAQRSAGSVSARRARSLSARTVRATIPIRASTIRSLLAPSRETASCRRASVSTLRKPPR